MSHVEELDDKIFNALVRINEGVQSKFPHTSVIESFLQASFESLTPEQRTKIVTDLGPEWYLKIAARMERRLAAIDQTL